MSAAFRSIDSSKERSSTYFFFKVFSLWWQGGERSKLKWVRFRSSYSNRQDRINWTVSNSKIDLEIEEDDSQQV